MSKLRDTLKSNRKPKAKKVNAMVSELHDNDEVVKTSFHFPKRWYKTLKVWCAGNDITVREYVIELIEADMIEKGIL